MEKIKKNFFEEAAWQAGMGVIGIDEVGRGCLAGPVVTAAVMLEPGALNPLLKDSKVLTKVQRERAYAWIVEHSHYAFGMASHHVIDSVNIYQATRLAMRKALIHLLTTVSMPQTILIDAMPVSLHDTPWHIIPIHHAPFGESWSSSIAAASILAKVYRDRLMNVFHALVPGYGLDEHKGYATARHRASVAQLGNSLIHRTTFMSYDHDISTILRGPAAHEQTSIF